MRPFLLWAVALSFLLIFSPQSEAQELPDVPSQYSGDWATALSRAESLIDDEYYRRDGVIREMNTCLLVAADQAAFQLWHEFPEWHDEKIPSLSTLLYQKGLDLKQRSGFGTILACVQILKSWYTFLPTRSRSRPVGGVDGRVEHGAVVIDLGLGKDGRASIDPLPLVRLLTSPNLLPRWAFGGIVVRRANIEGTLLLHNLHLAIPLVFSKVQFTGGDYRKDIYGIGRPISETAISIAHSRFSDYILFSESEICGDIRINDSHFDEKLEWRSINQRSLEKVAVDPVVFQCTDNQDKDNPTGIYVYSSVFSQSFDARSSSFGAMKIEGNSIDKFGSSRTRVDHSLKLYDNDIGSFFISSHLARENAISYNRIRNDFFISGRVFVDSEVTDTIKTIDINSNRIGGGLGFLNFPEKRLPGKLSFESNHVGNGSILCLPEDWFGTISLDGSSYDGKLVIGLTETGNREKADDSHALECSEAFRLPKRLKRNKDEYCLDLRYQPDSDRKKTVLIDLDAAEIRTLAWHLPLQCGYRWTGFGLKYRLWQPDDEAIKAFATAKGDASQSELQVFLAWRTTLGSHVSAPLDTMSRYLTENGAYNESRALLLEAKRLNYVPQCRPDRWVLTCVFILFGDVITGAFHSAATLWPFGASQAVAAAEGETNSEPNILRRLLSSLETIAVTFGDMAGNLWSWFLSLCLLILLWPGGYGAQPERAVFIMAIAIPSFWVAYRYYAYRLVHDLANVPSLIDPIRRHKFAKDLVARWPKKAAWMNDDSTSERPKSFLGFVLYAYDRWRLKDLHDKEAKQSKWLQQIQGPLLDAVKEKKEDMQAPNVRERLQLTALQQELERFGSTETIGFSRFEGTRMPKRFTRWQYSIDTMFPVIDLHAYSSYYPESSWMRFTSVCQHVVGWWLITVFIASAAIL